MGARGAAHRLRWETLRLSSPAERPDGASLPQLVPPDKGVRFEPIVLPPVRDKAVPAVDLKTALAGTEKLLPGLIGKMNLRHPGMYRTDMIDFIQVTEAGVHGSRSTVEQRRL